MHLTTILLAVTVPLAAAADVTLRTGDGLALSLSPQGRVSGLRAGDVSLRSGEPGGFWLTDYHDQPEPPNLVPNAGFEEGTTGWALAGSQQLDPTVAHGGRASVQLHVPGPTAAGSNLGIRVPVKPGRRYLVGLWLRRHDCGVTGSYVSELDAAGQNVGTQGQWGMVVPQGDDVWHKLQREHVTGPRTTQLNLRADIYRSTGTIWVDDFFVRELGRSVAQPVTGTVTGGETRAELTGEAARCGLTASFTATPDRLHVEGRIEDRTGRDRAVGVSFRLPVDATGWTWHDDIEDRRPVTDTGRYTNTYRCLSGEGICSVYPWSALSGQLAGLSLALPLDQGPRTFVIDYDADLKAFAVTFYFGLTPHSGKWPKSAGFAFDLYRHDPAWGLRDAVRRYYAAYPEPFVKRPTYEGYLNYANLERLERPAHTLGVRGTARTIDDYSDFGEGYDFVSHLHGCYYFKMMPTEDSSKPADETVFAFLNTLVEKERAQPDGYCPASEALKKIVYDAEGHICYIGDTRFWQPHQGYNSTDKAGWGLNFRVNEDPGISSYLAEKYRAKVTEATGRDGYRPYTACLTADAIEGYHGNQRQLDYRREHFATTRLPLSFGKLDLKPALINQIWDFLDGAWWPLSSERKVIISGNANSFEQIFTVPYVDLPIIETDWTIGADGPMDRYIRTVAHHRIWRFWRTLGKGEEDPASIVAHFDRGLAYAIFPAVYPVALVAGDVETYRPLYRTYVPAIEQLSRAGWEPVTLARTEASGVFLERYGDPARDNLHFTLRSEAAQDLTATVTLEPAARGQGPLLACDLLRGPHAATVIDPAAWPIDLRPGATRAFWVGSADALARWSRTWAAYDLDRLERQYAPELDDAGRAALTGCRQALGDAAEWHRRVDQLAGAVKTRAAMDLTKLVHRLHADLAGVAAADGLRADAPRIADGLRGGTAEVTFTVRNAAAAALSGLTAAVSEPWSKVAVSRCALAATSLPPGAQTTATAILAASADAPRELLPFLVRIEATAGGRPLRLDVPVDLRLKSPLRVAIEPFRACRGRDNAMTLVLVNPGAKALKGRLTIGTERGFTFAPAAFDFQVAPAGEFRQPLTVTLADSVMLDRRLLPYTITGDPAAVGAGSVAVVVTTEVPRATLARLSGPITVDGKLDEETWRRPPDIGRLGRTGDGADPQAATRVWVGYDDRGLYVAWRCDEPNMPGLKADLTQRGAPIYQEDDVEVFIASGQNAFPLQFAVNPLGTRNDNLDNNRDWTAAAVKLADGWTVEMFLPYALLGYPGPPKPGTEVLAQFGRQRKPTVEVTAWSKTPAFRDVSRYGELIVK